MAERLRVALDDLHSLIADGKARLSTLQRRTQPRADAGDRLSARARKNVARRSRRARQEASRVRSVHDDSRRLLRSASHQTEMKARAVQATAVAETNGSRLFLLACAWGVHLYTALGAVFGVLAIHYAAVGDYRASFIAMAITVAIDSSDGTLARFFNVKTARAGLRWRAARQYRRLPDLRGRAGVPDDPRGPRDRHASASRSRASC